MKIILNGQEQELSQSQNLKNFIENVCTQNQRVIAEVNGQIVNHPDWDKRTVKDGDRIELLNFIGGGSCQ